MSTCQNTPGPLATFFATYDRFEYNPAGSATGEFDRLCNFHRWNTKSKKTQRRTAWELFHDALTMQFNDNYGTDIENLTSWQALCAKLGMSPVPEDLKACRKAVRRTHVNLVDLVDIFDTPEIAHIFPSVGALSKYTKESKKFFPRDNVHAGSLLKFLLRQIRNPNARGQSLRA